MSAIDGHGAYVASYGAAAARWLDRDPTWLNELRAEAIAVFAERGFPSRRLEEWRYTNVAPIAKGGFELAERSAGPVDLSRARLASGDDPHDLPGRTMVFVDGHFRPELSSASEIGEVRALSLAQVRREDPALLEGRLGRQLELKSHPFAALATAFLDDGAVVVVPKGADAGAPVWLQFLSTGGVEPRVCHPRVLVAAEPSSHAQIVLDFASLGAAPHFTNAVVEVGVGANASVELVVVQRESDAAFHVSLLQAHVERDGRFASHTVTLGGALVRNDLEVTLVDEGADCTLRGLFAAKGKQRLDNHTLVDHAVPHGTSRELYKGILGGQSRGVFRGRVLVRPDAQKTDATQSNPNLLISNEAEIDTKPQLEIYADDVKCSHGATIGQLDADALFYLRSRGLAERAARDMLTRGFASEILAELPVPGLEAPLTDLLLQRLLAEAEEGEL